MSPALPAAAQSTSWNAPNFEVLPIDPWASVAAANNGVIPKNSSFPPITQLRAQITVSPMTGPLAAAIVQWGADAEGALKDAGNIYASISLKEPIFRPMVDSTTRGVFLFKFPGSVMHPNTKKLGGFYMPSICKTEFKDSWLAVNTNIHGIWQYKSIAHELFHSIQYQYAWTRDQFNSPVDCENNKTPWIFEGTADAAGFFLMEKKMGKKPKQSPPKNNYKFYGVRPYDVSLHETSSWHETYVKVRLGLGSELQAAVKSWFGYRTSSFWRFLMDRYGTISSVNSLNPDRLLALSEGFMERVAPDGGRDWLPWVAKGVEGNWGVFQHVYGAFLTEFAAWPGGKYPKNKLSTDFLLKKGFGGCKQVVLPGAKGEPSLTITLKPRVPSGYALYPISGRCIQVTVKDVKGKKIKLELEAHASSSEVAGQLVLGFAREEHKDGGVPLLEDDCYSHARKYPKKLFPCLFYGKVQKVTGAKNSTGIRTWRFEARKAKHSTVITTFVLTNVHPLFPDLDPETKKPYKTDRIKELKVIVGFPKSTGGTKKGKLGLAEPSRLGILPDPTIPRRQALYGITKTSAISTGYSMNLGPIQVAALDDTGKKKETYAITPLEPVAFGQTGPFKAMVMVASNGDLANGTISSQYCAPSVQPGSIGTIIRSDDEILEIFIDTPLCQLSTTNIMACEGGCPEVDHFQGTLSLPFGWRYFDENEIEDLVTPGVLLDIDRYHYNVFGTPLQGLSGGGSSGGNGSGGGGGGSGSGNTSGGGGSQGGTIPPPPCDCSCEGYEKHREKLKEIKASKIPDFNSLGQMLQCDQQCAKPFRECRRAEKRR